MDATSLVSQTFTKLLRWTSQHQLKQPPQELQILQLPTYFQRKHALDLYRRRPNLQIIGTLSLRYLETISLSIEYPVLIILQFLVENIFTFALKFVQNWQKKTFCQQIKFYVQAEKIEKVLFVEENQMAIYILAEFTELYIYIYFIERKVCWMWLADCRFENAYLDGIIGPNCYQSPISVIFLSPELG